MSSTILPYRHINAIVTYWSDEYRKLGKIVTDNEAQKLGEKLLAENIRNVREYYNLTDFSTHYLERYAYHTERHFVTKTKLALAVLKLCLAWEYQSCDTPIGDKVVWDNIEWIKSRAIESLKDYDILPWILDYD